MPSMEGSSKTRWAYPSGGGLTSFYSAHKMLAHTGTWVYYCVPTGGTPHYTARTYSVSTSR